MFHGRQVSVEVGWLTELDINSKQFINEIHKFLYCFHLKKNKFLDDDWGKPSIISVPMDNPTEWQWNYGFEKYALVTCNDENIKV
ncbi:hypothetical protein DERP_015133 [Dermatophagoides pteronyssinus]|uniref:Uncharacterized protein n=1 Tax=Dermatophagoides pteronyssinus TaxID=6956 RepID=A0ABQ8IYM4_DERPT|nr:hypothetical protein DERP_015133 [Dermatophagoides pteronyssinus]